MVSIYIFKLQEGKYYIASCIDYDNFDIGTQHIFNSSEWYKKYEPYIERIVYKSASPEDEGNYYKQLILEHGFNNVRCASYNLDTLEQVLKLKEEITSFNDPKGVFADYCKFSSNETKEDSYTFKLANESYSIGTSDDPSTISVDCTLSNSSVGTYEEKSTTDLQDQMKQLQLELTITKQELATLTRRHDAVQVYVKHLKGYLWGYKQSA